MSKYKSLAVTAEHFGMDVRTFKKDVTAKDIPHIIAGKRMKFDLVAVEAHYAALATPKAAIIKFPVRKPRPAKSEAFWR